MNDPDLPAADSRIAESDASPADIRVAAMNLLARREHSLGELRQKLRRRFDDEVMVETQLQKLAEENLQSDDRFAESFARQRAGRGYGPARVRQEMREKNLSDIAIARAFESAELDWWALAENVFRKRFGAPGRVELKEKARRIRFMQYRGFSADQYEHLLGD
ncbi:MAG: regulatory protein RecX [Halieaceae bacterium]|jgi:regulatory protein|nr:regulatory protein RecX [Halieaceae bacterium]